MISTDQLENVIGNRVVGSSGDKIGIVGQVYLDDASGQPEWATVNSGLFGTSESFVPLAQATLEGDDLRVPYDKDMVKGAPQVDADGHLSPQQEAELYRYYELTEPTSAEPVVGQDTTNRSVDDAMTRSEERLSFSTTRREVGTARLRKYVVTEQQSVTVPVSHQEAKLTREPVTDANRAESMDGPEITEAVHEVTLTAERPVVTKQTVPVERVRLDTETVTEQRQVSEQVRKEQIELDTDGETPRER